MDSSPNAQENNDSPYVNAVLRFGIAISRAHFALLISTELLHSLYRSLESSKVVPKESE